MIEQLPGLDYVRIMHRDDGDFGRVAIYARSSNSRRAIFEELSTDMHGDFCKPDVSKMYPLDWS